jgi:hypothetical protein
VLRTLIAQAFDVRNLEEALPRGGANRGQNAGIRELSYSLSGKFENVASATRLNQYSESLLHLTHGFLQ